jgi:hypothetical protein
MVSILDLPIEPFRLGIGLFVANCVCTPLRGVYDLGYFRDLYQAVAQERKEAAVKL